MFRWVTSVFGIVAGLLGGLWLLQGLGLVLMRPILCFVDCAPVQGPSLTWAIVGAITLAVGASGLVWTLWHRPAAQVPPKPGTRM